MHCVPVNLKMALADLVWELKDAEFKQLKTNRATVKLEAFNTNGAAVALKKMGYLVIPLKEIRLNGKFVCVCVCGK